jgi:hypothetical protein
MTPLCKIAVTHPREGHVHCFLDSLNRVAAYSQAKGDLPMFVIRVASWRTFSVANAQVPLSCLGTGERCAVVSDGDRCRARSGASSALRPGYDRACPVDTPELARGRVPVITRSGAYLPGPGNPARRLTDPEELL